MFERFVGHLARQHSRVTPELVAEMRQLRSQKKPYALIAGMLHVSPSTAWKYTRDDKCVSKHDLEATIILRQRGLSLREVGKALDSVITVEAVSRRLQRAGRSDLLGSAPVPDGFITARETAGMLGVNLSTIYAWVKRGVISSTALPPQKSRWQRRLFPHQVVLDYRASRICQRPGCGQRIQSNHLKHFCRECQQTATKEVLKELAAGKRLPRWAEGFNPDALSPETWVDRHQAAQILGYKSISHLYWLIRAGLIPSKPAVESKVSRGSPSRLYCRQHLEALAAMRQQASGDNRQHSEQESTQRSSLVFSRPSPV